MLRDTTIDAANVQWRALAALSGDERLRQALDLTDFVLKLQAEGRQALDEPPRPFELETGGTVRGSS